MKTKHLQFVLDALDSAPKKDLKGFNAQSYMGTSDPYLGVSNPEKYKIGRAFKKPFPDISFDELISLFTSLSQGKTFEEKTMPGFIIDRFPLHRSQIQPSHLDEWLEYLEGWCEIDSICQSTFPAEQLLNNWTDWKKYLVRFSNDTNISKRRASLVLLCKPVAQSSDECLKDLSFEIIETLKHETSPLVTKAISWLLRQMVENHRTDVERYLEMNKDSLPKIALRETRKVILTGKKT